MNTGILMQCDHSGKITYPNGATNYFEALDKVERKHNTRYVADKEKEHQHQLEPLPTNKSIYQAKEKKKIMDRHESICLVKAYLEFTTWKKRVEYMSKCGFEYPGTADAVSQRLRKKFEDMTRSGEWEKLVEAAKV